MRSTLVSTTLLSLLSLTSAAVLSVRATGCGIVGYDKASPKAVFFRKDDPASATFEGCQALCTTTARCVSFAIGKGECLLYPTIVTENVRVDSKSPFTFFAIECTKPSPVAAAQVTATPVPSNTNGGGGGNTSTGNGPSSQNQSQNQSQGQSQSQSQSPASSTSTPTSGTASGTPTSSSAAPDAAAPTNTPNAASSVTAASGLVMASLLVLQMLM